MAVYYMFLNGTRSGPHLPEEMVRMGLTADTSVRLDSTDEWIPASTVPELARLLKKPAPGSSHDSQGGPHRYELMVGGKVLGPFTVDELLLAGLTRFAPVRREGSSGWVSVGQLPEIANLFDFTVVPPPPTPSTPPPAGPSKSSDPAPYVYGSREYLNLRDRSMAAATRTPAGPTAVPPPAAPRNGPLCSNCKWDKDWSWVKVWTIVPFAMICASFAHPLLAPFLLVIPLMKSLTRCSGPPCPGPKSFRTGHPALGCLGGLLAAIIIAMVLGGIALGLLLGNRR